MYKDLESLSNMNLAEKYQQLAKDILADIDKRHQEGQNKFTLIYIKEDGEVPFNRIINHMVQLDPEIAFLTGSICPTLYRDDLNSPGSQPAVLPTELSEEAVKDSDIYVIDNVVQTGRTMRATMDKLTDLGRSKNIRYVTLINLPGRELPIHPDYAAIKLDYVPKSKEDHLIIEQGTSDDGSLDKIVKASELVKQTVS